jgi:hypothetical protein
VMRSEIVGLNGELLLECDGCFWHVPLLVERTFKDGWDSGEMVAGRYCRECCEIIDDEKALPNMSSGYRRLGIQCECSKCGAA